MVFYGVFAMRTPKIDREKNRLVWLPIHDLYLYQNRDQSFEKLGKALGVSHTSISKRMKEIVGIQTQESEPKPKKPFVDLEIGKEYEFSNGREKRYKEWRYGTVVDETRHFYVVQHANYTEYYRKMEIDIEVKTA